MSRIYLMAMIMLLIPISTFGANTNIGVVDTGYSSVEILDTLDYGVENNYFSNPYAEEFRNAREMIRPDRIEFDIESRRDFRSLPSRNDIKQLTYGLALDVRDCITCEVAVTSIQIIGNEGFKGFPGSGIQDDPYIIEGFDLSNPEIPFLVWIQDTDAFFEFRFNNLFGSNVGANIFLNNVTNGNLHNNYADNNIFGILIVDSDNLIVANNNLTSNNEGILIQNGSDIKIVANQVVNGANGITSDIGTKISVINNTISFNFGTGITFVDTTFSEIIGNTLAYNGEEGGDGILFIDSNDNDIRLNEIYGTGSSNYLSQEVFVNGLQDNKFVLSAVFGGVGIFLDPSFNNTIEDNNVYDNTGVGLYMQLSADSVVSRNRIYNNDLTGIFIEDSNNNEIVGNSVFGNGNPNSFAALATNDLELITYAGFGGVGIYLDPSIDNVVNDNQVFDNLGNGIRLEYSSKTSISNNTVDQNGLSGIFLLDSDYNTISRNKVTGNGQTLINLGIMSTGTAFQMKALAGFSGVGIYLDPSIGNVVEGNVIAGNIGVGTAVEESTDTQITGNTIISNGNDGVSLLNSANNTISGNTIGSNGYQASFPIGNINDAMNLYAGFGGVGIYLDPSPGNVIANNSVFDNRASGVYLLESNGTLVSSNNVTDNGAHGVFLQDSSFNNLTGNNIDSNGQILNAYGLSLNAGFGGVGIYLDPSWNNLIQFNNISSNFDDGIFSDGSHFTTIVNNVLFKNLGYGVYFDENSTNSDVFTNDFFYNGGKSSQALDDGIDNRFNNNFWSDYDNSGNPYLIDGTAGNSDTNPARFPHSSIGPPVIDVEMDFKPDAINALSRGRYVKVEITLPEEYELVSIDLSQLFLNGTINPVAYSIDDDNDDKRRERKKGDDNEDRKGDDDKDKHDDDRKGKDDHDDDDEDEKRGTEFKLFFYRRDVNDLINSLGIPGKFYTTLQVTGTINDGELGIIGSDIVKVTRTISNKWSFWWFLWWLFKHLGIFGIVLVKPVRDKIPILSKS